MQELANPEKQKTLSVRNIFAIPLTPDNCVNLLREIIKDKKWDNKAFAFFGERTVPENIVKMRKWLNDNKLTSVEMLQAIRGVLEEADLSTTQWLLNFLKEKTGIRDGEVSELYKYIVDLFDTLIQYQEFKEPSVGLSVKKQ